MIRNSFFLLVCFSTPFLKLGAQNLDIHKSSTGIAGGSYLVKTENLIVSHTIGQPSATGLLEAGSVQLLQGFEHLLINGKVADAAKASTLIVSPNPSKGPTTLKWKESDLEEDIHVEIFDLKGKRLVSKKTTRIGMMAKLDLKLTDGIYLLKTTGSLSGHEEHLIIIQK